MTELNLGAKEAYIWALCQIFHIQIVIQQLKKQKVKTNKHACA